MHKAVILLMKAESREDAKNKTNEFMEGYGDGNVWDWFQIGGRWSRILNQLKGKFDKEAKEMCLAFQMKNQETIDVGELYQKTVNEMQDELNVLWKKIGGSGQNPWNNHYDLPKSGTNDDIMPLCDCIEIVKDRQQDYIEVGKKELACASEWLDGKRGTNDYNMYGYVLGCAAKLFQQSFSFECNVFNIEKFNFSLPDDYDGWYAVVIDMHN